MKEAEQPTPDFIIETLQHAHDVIGAHRSSTEAYYDLKLFRLRAINAAKDMVNSHASLEEENKRLRKFKDYVHKRLDDAGIEKEPNGEHSKHGCRIGDRLDILLKDSIAIELALKIAEYSKQLEEKDRERDEYVCQFIDWLRERYSIDHHAMQTPKTALEIFKLKKP